MTNLRVVTRFPVEEVWSEQGRVARHRIRDLSEWDVKGLLRAGLVQFVVADVRHVLKWVALEQTFDFWKVEVQPHLLSPDVVQHGVQLERLLDEYGYEASEWEWPDVSLVLLTKWH